MKQADQSEISNLDQHLIFHYDLISNEMLLVYWRSNAIYINVELF